MPTVIGFLGFDPSASPDSLNLGTRMTAYRRLHGFSIKEAAKRAGVDPDSWSIWERTGMIPTQRGRERVSEYSTEAMHECSLLAPGRCRAAFPFCAGRAPLRAMSA
jgi:transcriptional regulator with XRE-family HTH domain